MTDIDVLTQTELFALNPILPAIRCMLPKRENEDNTLVMTRQISGLNLLWKLDRFDFQWSDESSQMLLDVDTKNTNSLDPLHCLISFLEQNHQEGYKAQAAQVFGMIIEQGSLNDRLNTLGLPKILEKWTVHPNRIVKQNAIEALELLREKPDDDSEFGEGDSEEGEYE